MTLSDRSGSSGDRGGAAPHWLFAVLVMGGLVALFTVSALEPLACGSGPYSRAVAQGEAAWCWEFWFARYQTLIAAILSLAGAAWAAILLIRQNRNISNQIDESRRQRAIDLHTRLVEHWRDIEKFRKLKTQLSSFLNKFEFISIELDIDFSRSIDTTSIAEDFDHLRTYAEHFRDTADKILENGFILWSEFSGGPRLINHTRRIIREFDTLVDEFGSALFGSLPLEDESEESREAKRDELTREMIRICNERREAIRILARKLSSLIQLERRQTEARLTEIEAIMSDGISR